MKQIKNFSMAATLVLGVSALFSAFGPVYSGAGRENA